MPFGFLPESMFTFTGIPKCLGKPRKSFVGILTRFYFCELRGKEFFNSHAFADNRSLEGMNTSPELILLCGKMAAGKSTLAKGTWNHIEEADAENETAEHADKTSPVESGIARQPGTRTDLPVQFHICLKLMIARLRPKTCRFRTAL